MQRMLMLCLCLAAAQLYRAARVPEPMQLSDVIKRAWNAPPNFPDAYEMEYNFTMPYFLLLQPQGLSYPVHVWVDKAAQSVRIDFRGGIDRTYFVKKEEYSITPQKDKLVCSEYSHGGGPVRKTLSLPQGMLGKQVLPDMSEWVDFGPAQVDGFEAHMWQKKDMAGEKVNTYTFYISEAGTPIKFHSVGQDYFGGSHYDEYIYEWTMFKAGPVDPAVFEIPDLCKETQAQLVTDSSTSSSSSNSRERHHKAMQAVALLPGNHQQHKDEANYHGWCHFHNRQHIDTTDYTNRLATFTANKAQIVAHNMKIAAAAAGTASSTSDEASEAPGHTLKLNHFSDWSREEFDRVMLPKKWKREHGIKQEQVRAKPLRTFKSALTKSKFPRSFDWRATPADFAVKDQGQCGSCWAFAAVGTMEGSWFVATGAPRSFSEQQLIDCAWDEGPSGCDGGEYQDAFRYIEKSSGIAATQDYPYVGQNDFCRDTNAKISGHFTGYVEVESRSEESVMEALMKYGPLAVGVDATFDDFLFYSEGIYHHKGCALKPRKLDHAVILVGWGTDEKTDEKYWIVKNSWSKYWGDDGYIKIHRGGNDCGIASDAVFAEVSADYIVPGAAERALQLVLGKSQLP